ncbi:SPOSA6832_04116 [Sporobolomyces salmonicolor]|uniref:SPOSA6832_04116-mRNA-1:cds n=1 Tax=Sporidiobolus salmonicolor TaxID=5005 RepID=A0A0D6ERY1_SPOSA|nr:SPOSA6832_04116 [Sporobolomyces salmonicolor]
MPALGEPRPSTSAWQWHSHYRLYYNPTTRQWAAPQPDGSWKYADADAADAADAAAPRENGLEEGEIEGGLFDPREEQVWPGDDDDEAVAGPDPFAHAPLLRLVVKSSDPAILPPEHTVASLDPAEPVSIGRDRSHERRIRLKELAVSKAHATLFWSVDPEAEQGGFWAVVDNGSTHGTYLRSDGKRTEIRLSEPKKGGVPHPLHHLDTLRAGSTTFVVHIHPSFACSACTVASDSSNLIPLLSAPTDDPSKATPTYATKTKEEKEQERREQMRGLKEKLLKPATNRTPAPSAPTTVPSPTASSRPSSPAFVDRAAARRARDASARPSRPAAAKPGPTPFFTVPGRTPTSSFAAPPSASAAPPASYSAPNPFSSDSKGAQLLSKLSGPAASPSPTATSSTLPGSNRSPGLGTLIEARTLDTSAVGRDARPGLGSRPLVDIATLGGAASGASEKRDWREDVREASRKRFREIGRGTST